MNSENNFRPNANVADRNKLLTRRAMKAIAKLIMLVCAFTFSSLVHADSPVISTGFSAAYKDIRLIREARESGAITTKMIAFLRNPKVDLGQKAA